MRFHKLIKDNMRHIFLENACKKWDSENISRPLAFFKNALYEIKTWHAEKNVQCFKKAYITFYQLANFKFISSEIDMWTFVYFQVYEVVYSEIYVNFLYKPFRYMQDQQQQDRNFNTLRMNGAFRVKWKTFLSFFKGFCFSNNISSQKISLTTSLKIIIKATLIWDVIFQPFQGNPKSSLFCPITD